MGILSLVTNSQHITAIEYSTVYGPYKLLSIAAVSYLHRQTMFPLSGSHESAKSICKPHGSL